MVQMDTKNERKEKKRKERKGLRQVNSSMI